MEGEVSKWVTEKEKNKGKNGKKGEKGRKKKKKKEVCIG